METAWQKLVEKYNLTDLQLSQFKIYLAELVSWNQKFNITAITNQLEIISYHFDDALSLAKFIDLKNLNAIADVGSGGGFPGMPIKILYPHLKLTLIEVNGKKVEFLKSLAESLGLSDVNVAQIDWRAFVREGQMEIDLFCARASLQVEELLRIYKPSSVYKKSKLVYWASQNWELQDLVVNLQVDVFDYQVLDKKRKLVIFEPKKDQI